MKDRGEELADPAEIHDHKICPGCRCGNRGQYAGAAEPFFFGKLVRTRRRRRTAVQRGKGRVKFIPETGAEIRAVTAFAGSLNNNLEFIRTVYPFHNCLFFN